MALRVVRSLVLSLGLPLGLSLGLSLGVAACAFAGSSGIDLPADAAVDAEVDSMPMTTTCPATYQIVAGTPLGSRYRKLDVARGWDAQSQLCIADGAHLAVPDSDAERAALMTFGANVRGLFWIGLTDAETEGTWKTVKGQVVGAAELLWGPGQPAAGMAADGEDCLLLGQTGMRPYYDFTCASAYAAVCECD